MQTDPLKSMSNLAWQKPAVVGVSEQAV